MVGWSDDCAPDLPRAKHPTIRPSDHPTHLPIPYFRSTSRTRSSGIASDLPILLSTVVAMTMGDEAKQIIIITDGWPSHSNAKGKWQTKTLRRFVREEVLTARRIGMNVTGVVIGNDMNDEGLCHMLGPPTNWKRLDKHKLGDGLVQVVSSSFTKYLRNG